MTVWYVALLAVIIAAVGAFLVLRLRADLVAAIDRRLGGAADQIALGYHTEGPPEARDVAATLLSGEAGGAQVLTPDGRVTVAYGDRVARVPLLGARDRARVAAGARLRRTVDVGAGYRVAARQVLRGVHPRVVVAAESLVTVDRSVHRLLVLLLLAGPAALAATALGGWWLARRALRPIDRLTARAGAIGIDGLDERLEAGAARDEVARLAATLNMMLSRIAGGVREQRRLVADASHELRTPLAAMRTELEVSLRADALDEPARVVLASTLEEVERLSRTVDGLLLLARADDGTLELRIGDVDLAEVARETAARLDVLARARGVEVVVDGAAAPARGDAAWLGQALGNLMDNAIELTRPGGAVRVKTAVEDGRALVRVTDEGPGIPDADRERVFDRFHRLDPSRTRTTGGAGIGLAIVREITRAHGGRVWNEPAPGGGTTFVLALPAAAAVSRDRGGGVVMSRA
jgi:heavy metal sensor kinase